MHTNDTLLALPPDQIQAFLHHLNSIKPPIQFMIEEESQGTILFLDTMVTRHDNGFLSDHRVLQEDSHRPLAGFLNPPHSCTQGYSYTYRAHQTRSAVSSKTKTWTRSSSTKPYRLAATPKPWSTNTGELFHLTTRHAQGYYSPSDIDIPDPLRDM